MKVARILKEGLTVGGGVGAAIVTSKIIESVVKEDLEGAAKTLAFVGSVAIVTYVTIKVSDAIKDGIETIENRVRSFKETKNSTIE